MMMVALAFLFSSMPIILADDFVLINARCTYANVFTSRLLIIPH